MYERKTRPTNLANFGEQQIFGFFFLLRSFILLGGEHTFGKAWRDDDDDNNDYVNKNMVLSVFRHSCAQLVVQNVVANPHIVYMLHTFAFICVKTKRQGILSVYTNFGVFFSSLSLYEMRSLNSR